MWRVISWKQYIYELRGELVVFLLIFMVSIKIIFWQIFIVTDNSYNNIKIRMKIICFVLTP